MECPRGEMGRFVPARFRIPVEPKAADSRGQGVPLVGDRRVGNSERWDAAAESRSPGPDTGTDSESKWGHRRRRMGAMGCSYSGSRSRSKDAWCRRGVPDSDAVACPESRIRRIESGLFSSHPESR